MSKDNNKHLFLFVLSISISSFITCPIFFCPFYEWFICLPILGCKNSSRITNKNALSDTGFVNPLPVCCLRFNFFPFVFYRMSFDEQMLNFDEAQIINIFSLYCAFGLVFNNYLPISRLEIFSSINFIILAFTFKSICIWSFSKGSMVECISWSCQSKILQTEGLKGQGFIFS